MKYLIKNPNKFMVPIFLQEGPVQKQFNLMPKSSIKITEDQLTSAISNLSSRPRNVLIIKLEKE